ncbi:MAG: hypothetical protein SGI92_24330 [Bryobacteraceae bacterium]|nr:hypothetical protein [Bryobacteraceae bacterium]
MPVIEFSLDIHPPIEACFDAARDIDLHQRSMQHTGERAIAGVTSALIAYESPAGLFGHIADAVFLKSYMRNLLYQRARAIRDALESTD